MKGSTIRNNSHNESFPPHPPKKQTIGYWSLWRVLKNHHNNNDNNNNKVSLDIYVSIILRHFLCLYVLFIDTHI